MRWILERTIQPTPDGFTRDGLGWFVGVSWSGYFMPKFQVTPVANWKLFAEMLKSVDWVQELHVSVT